MVVSPQTLHADDLVAFFTGQSDDCEQASRNLGSVLNLGCSETQHLLGQTQKLLDVPHAREPDAAQEVEYRKLSVTGFIDAIATITARTACNFVVVHTLALKRRDILTLDSLQSQGRKQITHKRRFIGRRFRTHCQRRHQ
jgi:hypothetical protein